MVERRGAGGAHRARRLASALSGVLALAPVALALAAPVEFGDPDKGWTELNPDLPAPPEDNQLVEFYVSPVTSFHFALDQKSISIGSDGVVRFTLVATSSSGVRNARFEGLRCESNEFKIYAVARPDGQWERTREPAWKHIAESGNNREEAALAKDAICANGIAFSVADILRHLKLSVRGSIPF